MGLVAQSGREGKHSRHPTTLAGARLAERVVQRRANLGLGQENKHRKYSRLINTMGSLLSFKEVIWDTVAGRARPQPSSNSWQILHRLLGPGFLFGWFWIFPGCGFSF